MEQKKGRRLLLLGFISAALIASSAACSNEPSQVASSSNQNGYDEQTPILLHNETFFVGGSYNGAQYTGQSMIHRLSLGEQNTPIVMLPGLGLSAYIYTSTPDGRAGWTSDFAAAGFDTYAVDTHNLAVSGLDAAAFGTENQPSLSVWGESKIWKTWGFGDNPNEPYPDTQYPVEYIEQLYASFSPQISESKSSGVAGTETQSSVKDGGSVEQQPAGRRIGAPADVQAPEGAAKGGQRPAGTEQAEGAGQGGQSSRNADPVEVQNMIALLERTGPSVLMVHSMGGVTGFEVVRQRPELVKALIVIEPVGSPTDKTDLEQHFVNVPYLAVYGDYIESRGQTGRYESCIETAKVLNELGGYGEVMTLTDLGYKGNTHLMMQDRNKEEIAEHIIQWIQLHVKA
ncbi:hypothetical protein [Paenibacillus sp. PL2-23]|uniref:hypothetical protein n=1 Tax=Paenibacillus sp. PL2-23 TaxID=2100729 RepID=UPI0030FB0235